MRGLVADAAGAGDVLVAPATPPGSGALAIVRLSGPPGRTLAVARALAPALLEIEPRRATLARFVDAAGAPLDEGLVLLFAAPASATGEEVVELHCHGARPVVRALVEAACRAGARPARPGEFTRRALANGRLTLARAEGIAGLAAAGSRGEARRALGLYDGALSDAVAVLRERLLDLLAEVEASLDFAEDVARAPREEVGARIDELAGEARRLARGPLVRTSDVPPAIAILGRPNAGKSTLFNALLGEDRAIVTEHPGTTRDVLAEEVELGGERVRVLDTAGLRAGGEAIERIGIARARAAARDAALVLYLVDGSAGHAEEDRVTLAALETPHLLVATKADLGPARGLAGALAVSALRGDGLERLGEAVRERLGTGPSEVGVPLLARHREALERAEKELRAARERLAEGEELAADALRHALAALGEITGETAPEELLDRIFSTFCIGK